MYYIAKLKFCIRNLTRDRSAVRLIPFLCTTGTPELVYEIQFCENLNAECKGKEFSRNASVTAYYSDAGVSIAYNQNGQIYAVNREREGKTILYLPEKIREANWHYYFIPDILHLERPLLQKGCFVLHSSYIATEKGAIIFTAPSGGGKTTQANLWVANKNARIINGDKTAIGKENDRWFAYGLPISGSSPYYLNETHPIRAIVILEKSQENQLYPIGLSAFSRIYSQTILNTWDGEYCSKMVDLVARACMEIPVYLYRCTKSPEAVDMLQRALLRKEFDYGNE